MSLSRYADQTDAIAQELLASLSESDIAALRARLSGMTQAEWWRWRDKQEAQLAAYASATVSQRARKAGFREDRILLTLGAALYCLEAAALLKAILPLSPGCSYRKMAVLAGRAFQEIMETPIPDWPFDGEPPFRE
jgi:hypothetical protein